MQRTSCILKVPFVLALYFLTYYGSHGYGYFTKCGPRRLSRKQGNSAPVTSSSTQKRHAYPPMMSSYLTVPRATALSLESRSLVERYTRPRRVHWVDSSTRLYLFSGHHTVLVEQATQSLFRYDGLVPFHYAFILNAVLFTAFQSKLFKMLTLSGFVHAMILGTMLWTTLGWRGWTLCVFYLLLGNLVTKVRFADKQKRGLAEGRGGRRGPENVWGSAATYLACALCSTMSQKLHHPFLGISSNLYLLGGVASLATKLADTFASEIGKAYGKTTFLITTWERVTPGTEGAVSIEGTAASILGGFLLAMYGWAIHLIHGPVAVLITTIAAFVATNVESVLGATLQGKKGLNWMTNEVVNGINTFIGAVLAIMAGRLFLGMR